MGAAYVITAHQVKNTTTLQGAGIYPDAPDRKLGDHKRHPPPQVKLALMFAADGGLSQKPLNEKPPHTPSFAQLLLVQMRRHR